MKNRIDDIEILRAFAVLLVIIEHMHLNLFSWGTPWLKVFYQHFSGWSGVDLFFVISGYVIAKNLVPRLQASGSGREYRLNTFVFWVRRFWRLIPSAWFWLCFILCATVFFNSSGVWGNLSSNLHMVLAAVLQFANVYVGLIFGTEFAGAAFVYWSLSLEEQFYLVLPLLVLLSGRKLRYVLVFIVVSQIFLERPTPLLALLRTEALFLGVLIALWSQSPSYRRWEPRFLGNAGVAFVVFGLLLGLLSFADTENAFIVRYRYSLIAFVSALLVFAASYDRDYFSRPGWLKAVLLWVGTRSYALYLAHLPSYFMTREIWFRLEPAGTRFDASYTAAFLGTALLILVTCSELNYRLIETPFRKYGVRIARRMIDRAPD